MSTFIGHVSSAKKTWPTQKQDLGFYSKSVIKFWNPHTTLIIQISNYHQCPEWCNQKPKCFSKLLDSFSLLKISGKTIDEFNSH